MLGNARRYWKSPSENRSALTPLYHVFDHLVERSRLGRRLAWLLCHECKTIFTQRRGEERIRLLTALSAAQVRQANLADLVS